MKDYGNRIKNRLNEVLRTGDWNELFDAIPGLCFVLNNGKVVTYEKGKIRTEKGLEPLPIGRIKKFCIKKRPLKHSALRDSKI